MPAGFSTTSTQPMPDSPSQATSARERKRTAIPHMTSRGCDRRGEPGRLRGQAGQAAQHLDHGPGRRRPVHPRSAAPAAGRRRHRDRRRNSYYRDDIGRAADLKRDGIHFIDVGTSGGVWGLDRGYCLMIGGEDEPVRRVDPIFKTIAPGKGSAQPTPGLQPGGTAEQGYLHCGPSGAGHFVKMVHNGIEYGMMAAIAEGLSVIRGADVGLHMDEIDAETTPLRDPWAYQYEIDVSQVAEVWRRGSVISSWLIDLTAAAFAKSPDLEEF